MLYKRIHHKSIDSTNNWAKAHAHEFNQEALTLITAEAQTAGRGRFDRRWVSPAGQNVYATFAFFLPSLRHDIANVPQVLAISAVQVIERKGLIPKLKWPNDILLSNKKVAGILCETIGVNERVCVILGIGINVNMPLELLEAIDRPATSLLAEDAIMREVETVTRELQDQFCCDLPIFLSQGFGSFLSDYRRYLKHQFEDPIEFHDNSKVIHGKYKGINEDGSLNLELERGRTQPFYAGEILFSTIHN